MRVKNINLTTDVNNNITLQKNFPNNINLRCDDHIKFFFQDTEATRFCNHCRTLCCDSCVIEFHNEHIDLAKEKIDDYFHKQKIALEKLSEKISILLKNKKELISLNGNGKAHKEIIDSFFLRRQNILDELKRKIDIIANEEKDVHRKIKDEMEIFYNEERYNKLNKPLREINELLNKVQRFICEWESYSNKDKSIAVKNNQIGIFEDESNELQQIFDYEYNSFNIKKVDIEKKIEKILGYITYPISFLEFEKERANLLNNLIEAKKFISILRNVDVNFDKEKSRKIEHNSFNKKEEELQNSPHLGRSSSQQYNSNMDLSLKESSLSIKESSSICNSTVHKVNFQAYIERNRRKMKENEQKVKMETNIKNPQFSISNIFEFQLLITLKQKEIIIYEPKTGFHSISFGLNNFQDHSNTFFSFPKHSRYVNLGSSLFLTGGYLNNKKISHCYNLIISSSGKYEVNIISYKKMLECREQHNILFLPDKNIVLVCGGVASSTSEYTDLLSNRWERVAELKESRANGTMAYINNRYIYLIGGVRENSKNINSVYLGSCEFLDFDNREKGWKMVNFGDDSIKLCSMGVVYMQNSSFMICGGFNGKENRKEVYKVDATDIENPKICLGEVSLPNKYIFNHNNFLKIGDEALNCEGEGNIVLYKYTNNGFKLMSV